MTENQNLKLRAAVSFDELTPRPSFDKVLNKIFINFFKIFRSSTNCLNSQKLPLKINPRKKLQKRFFCFAKNLITRKRKNQFQNRETARFSKIYLL